jgi:hypothetical protein
VEDKTFLEALTVVLDNTLRDLVYYSVGIIINVTLHAESRMNILESTTNIVPKLIGVLNDSNIEDIDMSLVVSKALHNLTQAKQEYKAHINDYWSNDSIHKLEEVLENLGDELDQIMVSSTLLSSFFYNFSCCRTWHRQVSWSKYSHFGG